MRKKRKRKKLKQNIFKSELFIVIWFVKNYGSWNSFFSVVQKCKVFSFADASTSKVSGKIWKSILISLVETDDKNNSLKNFLLKGNGW